MTSENLRKEKKTMKSDKEHKKKKSCSIFRVYYLVTKYRSFVVGKNDILAGAENT